MHQYDGFQTTFFNVKFQHVPSDNIFLLICSVKTLQSPSGIKT